MNNQFYRKFHVFLQKHNAVKTLPEDLEALISAHAEDPLNLAHTILATFLNDINLNNNYTSDIRAMVVDTFLMGFWLGMATQDNAHIAKTISYLMEEAEHNYNKERQ